MRKIISLASISTLLTTSAILALLVPQVSFGFCTDNVKSEYKTAAEYLFDEEVLKGNPDGSCSLDKEINRIEFAIMAMRAVYGEEDAQMDFEAGLFNDLNDGTVWYAKYAAAAKHFGILKGDGNGNLRASDPVNAAEAAVITARAVGITFEGNSSEPWYKPTMDAFKANNVKTYDPNHKMTRGEVVVMIFDVDNNYFELVDYSNGESSDPGDDSAGSDDSSYDDSSYNDSSSDNSSSYTDNTQSSGGSGGVVMTPLRYLAEYFDQLSAQQVAQIVYGLSETDRLNLSVYQAFASLVHYQACQADPNIVISPAYYPDTCAQTTQSWQNTLYFSNNDWQQATSYAYQSRNELLIGVKCSTGELDQASCSTYATTMSNINNMQHDAMTNVINNLGNGCSSPGQYLPDGSYCAPSF